jgi:hypothetical protein
MPGSADRMCGATLIGASPNVVNGDIYARNGKPVMFVGRLC